MLYYIIDKLKNLFSENEEIDSSLLQHVKHELYLSGYDDISLKDCYNKMAYDHILHMIKEFSKEDHSGFSASYCIGVINKLLNFGILTPLTGNDDEWIDVCDDFYQNKRLSNIFKEKSTGKSYTLDYRVFYDLDERELYPEEDGYPGRTSYKNYFTNGDSREYITFPYYPKEPIYINIEDWEFSKMPLHKKCVVYLNKVLKQGV